VGAKRQIPRVLLEKARELRKQQTPAEEILWECLRDRRLLNLKFRRQHNIGQYIADFYCHELKLVIELDGGIHQQTALRDQDRDRWMQEHSIQVLRFKNEQIFTNLENILAEIAHLLSPSETPSETPSHIQSPSPVGEGLGVREKDLANAIQTCLSLAVDRQANTLTSLSRWNITGEKIEGLFARQAIPMVWDFVEANSFSGASGGLNGALAWIFDVCKSNAHLEGIEGQTEQTSATNLFYLPDDAAQFLCTDPPYYDAVPYADLSDFFYVWLKRTLPPNLSANFSNKLTPKDDECIVDEVKGKDKAFFERTMGKAMAEGRRVVAPNGIGLIVFAHKSTAGWEAQLQAMIDAGWIFTGSWTIDTEMGNRLRAMNSAALASSVHLVCRPRSNNEIGDWRNILQELPLRIKEWMPRLTEQGVVGADAIFACLGPALEIFSRYSSVEKASGEIVPLREYLEYVWAAISKEALSTIFKDADTSNFEEDARLTAMWLWTLSAGEASPPAPLPDGEGSDDDDDDENTSKKPKITGFSLEYDTARKIAQGLGAHLENLTHLVEVKGDKARLLPVKERAAYLFGKEGMIPDIPKKKAKGDKQLTLIGVLDELPEDEYGEVKISRIGETICDKVHQAMLLFNSGRSEALKRFLVDEAIGKDARFWQLAQSFSALYPAGTDEKRWVDGLLARKKGLGL
jgi:very-short-patch-repair endonuclease